MLDDGIWCYHRRHKYHHLTKTLHLTLKMTMQIANCLFNVVTQSPKPEARDQYSRRHRFWCESWFLRREENWKTRRKTLGVRLRLTSAHVRAQDQTRVSVVGPLRQPDSHLTTAQVIETSVTNNSLSKDYSHPDDHSRQTRNLNCLF